MTGVPGLGNAGSGKDIDMVKVSVIVPVRNAGQELYACVQSLLDQTMEEMEILLVDDASSDGCREIVADCQAQFPEEIRAVYLEQERGLGGARNAGIDMARGEYAAFVESWDTVDDTMCDALYDAAGGADMAGADYEADGKEVRPHYGQPRDLTSQEAKAAYIEDCGIFESRIYRLDFLRKNALRFPENNAFSEHYFNFMTALYAGSAVKASGVYYRHTDRQIPRNDPAMYQRLEIPSRMIADCRERGIYEANKDLIDYKYIGMQMGNLRFVCLGGFDVPDAGRVEQLRQAVIRDCPDYASGKYYARTLWQMRYYLEKAMKDPEKAIRAFKKDPWVEFRASVRTRFGKNR